MLLARPGRPLAPVRASQARVDASAASWAANRRVALRSNGAPVPVLVGCNSNEGTFFIHGAASASALKAQLTGLTYGNASLLSQAEKLYPATGGRYYQAMAASIGHAKVACVARRVHSTFSFVSPSRRSLQQFSFGLISTICSLHRSIVSTP